MVKLSSIPTDYFRGSYYDSEYFRGLEGGKSFRQSNGSISKWSYYNLSGEWLGCKQITEAWKEIFSPINLLDVGCGRGQIVAYARDIRIEAEGFDFSEWAIGDEGRFARTRKEWVRVHDATEKWPYDDKSFDVVSALDFFEHIYEDDVDFVISEIYRVARKWIFLQIAVSETSGLMGRHELGYSFKKDEAVPMELEGCAVSGHVTVQPEEFWIEKFESEKSFLRRDMKNWFVSLVDNNILMNWLKNSILVYEIFED